MITSYQYQEIQQMPPSIVGIGNFDGLHQGHMSLISKVNERALERTLRSTVLTFDPHPIAFFRGSGPAAIYSVQDRLSLLSFYGVEYTLIQRFDDPFSQLSPRAFATQILKGSLNAQCVVVGYDFAFGQRRVGRVETLQALGLELGFEVVVIEAHHNSDSDEVFSSTWVRREIVSGQVEAVSRALGRAYHVYGQVVRGHQRGRKIGFPTANLSVSSTLCPGPGVYAGWLDWGEGPRPSIISIGTNPTFTQASSLDPTPVGAQESIRVEVHVLSDTSNVAHSTVAPLTLDLYALEVTLWFHRSIRGIVRFEGISALSAQIDRDCHLARTMLCNTPPPQWPQRPQRSSG
jgi:riboflavin kinase / FMN adenylyltransferase